MPRWRPRNARRPRCTTCPSPRHVSLEQAAALRCARVPREIKVVLLLVNEQPRYDRAGDPGGARPDVVQFHGKESLEVARAARQYTAAGDMEGDGVSETVNPRARPALAKGAADMLLYDAPAKKLPGGQASRSTGQLLANFRHTMPWASPAG